MQWVSEDFEVAMAYGPHRVGGKTCNGLGLHLLRIETRSKKGKRTRPARWKLSHLGTGHGLIELVGSLAVVLPVATEIAMAGDWTFDGMDGWKNQFPDAPERLREVMNRHPAICKAPPGVGPHREIAQKIALNRAA